MRRLAALLLLAFVGVACDEPTDDLPPGAECTPGSRKSAGDGCNTCDCNSDGRWACTLVGCIACYPGEVQLAADNCNICTCTDWEWECGTTDCSPVTCGGIGGFGGNPCTEDQYCGYEANQNGCGVGDATSICKPRPPECPIQSYPVCGCDGETYASACLANQAGTGVYTDQPCLEAN